MEGLTLGMFRALLLPALLFGCTPPQRTRTPVILVSIDGFRADYLDRGLTPVLSGLAQEGVQGRGAGTGLPHQDLPQPLQHRDRSLAGHARHHRQRVLCARRSGAAFEMSDRDAVHDPRFWGAEPIWVTAERQGVTHRPAVLAGERGCDRRACGRPTCCRTTTRCRIGARVQQVLEWLDLPPDRRPAFLTLYTSVVDAAGHEFGPDAPETRRAIVQADSTGRTAPRGAEVPAHGAEGGPDRRLRPRNGGHVAEPGDLPRRLRRPRRRGGGRSFPGSDAATASGTRGLGLPRSSIRAPHLTAYRRGELPRRFHLAESPRVPPLVGLADEGWVIRWRGRSARVGLGDHGYDDSLASMRAIFIAHGPDFRRGIVVPEFRNIHVYALLAELLRIRPAATDGSLDSVRAMLNRASTTSGTGRVPASPSAAATRGDSSAARAPR